MHYAQVQNEFTRWTPSRMEVEDLVKEAMVWTPGELWSVVPGMVHKKLNLSNLVTCTQLSCTFQILFIHLVVRHAFLSFQKAHFFRGCDWRDPGTAWGQTDRAPLK